MAEDILGRRAKAEREWFKKEYEKQFSKRTRDEKDEEAALDKAVQKFRKLSNRNVCERKQFCPTVTLPVSSEPVEWYRTPLAIKCVCPTGDCSCCCKGNTLLPAKRLPFVPRYNWWGLKKLLWKLGFMKYDEPAGTFTPQLVTTVKRESLFYRSAEGRAILIERGPEFCLSGCLKFFITNRTLEKNFAAAIAEAKEQVKEEEEEVKIEADEVKTVIKTPERKVMSDRVCFQYRCTVSSQAETDAAGEFVIGQYSHLLFGSPDENILCDIHGVELQVSCYKDDLSSVTEDASAFSSVTKTANKLFHVEQIKQHISKVKKDLITSIFEIPVRFYSKESQYKCSDIPVELQQTEGLCESLADVRRRLKAKDCPKKSLENALDRDKAKQTVIEVSGPDSFANESSYKNKITPSYSDNILASDELKHFLVDEPDAKLCINKNESVKECTPVASESKTDEQSVTAVQSEREERNKSHSSLISQGDVKSLEQMINTQPQNIQSTTKLDNKALGYITDATLTIGDTSNAKSNVKQPKFIYVKPFNKAEEHVTTLQKYQVPSTLEKHNTSKQELIIKTATEETPVVIEKEKSSDVLNLQLIPKQDDKPMTSINLKLGSNLDSDNENQFLTKPEIDTKATTEYVTDSLSSMTKLFDDKMKQPISEDLLPKFTNSKTELPCKLCDKDRNHNENHSITDLICGKSLHKIEIDKIVNGDDRNIKKLISSPNTDEVLSTAKEQLFTAPELKISSDNEEAKKQSIVNICKQCNVSNEVTGAAQHLCWKTQNDVDNNLLSKTTIKIEENKANNPNPIIDRSNSSDIIPFHHIIQFNEKRNEDTATKENEVISGRVIEDTKTTNIEENKANNPNAVINKFDYSNMVLFNQRVQFNENRKEETETNENEKEVLSSGVIKNKILETSNSQKSRDSFAKKIRQTLSKFSWKSLLSSHSVNGKRHETPIPMHISNKQSCKTMAFDDANKSKLSYNNSLDKQYASVGKEKISTSLENERSEKDESNIKGPGSDNIIKNNSEDDNAILSTTIDQLETNLNKYYRFYY